MQRAWNSWLQALAVMLLVPCLFTGVASGQSVFTLGFSGETDFAGSAGQTVSGDYFCTLLQENIPPRPAPDSGFATVEEACADPGCAEICADCKGYGAQGWSLSIVADNATITSISSGKSDGSTDVGDWYAGGFDKTQVCDPNVLILVDPGDGTITKCDQADPDPACVPQGPGVVSAVVLSFSSGETLPDDQLYRVAVLGVEAVIPAGGGTATLRYEDGKVGAGQPVINNITQEGATKEAVSTDMTINLIEVQTCCGDEVNVGFSATKIEPADAAVDMLWEGVLGDTTELCDGSGQLVAEIQEGETGAATVYANVISQLPPLDPPDTIFPPNLGGVQGWSFSFRQAGDLIITGIARTGAAEPSVGTDPVVEPPDPGTHGGGYYNGGFNKTQVADPNVLVIYETDGTVTKCDQADPDPACVAQGPGAVSAVVLSFSAGNTLPPAGTFTVTEISVEANAPQGDDPIVGMVKFESGLVGSGQPVVNAVTVDGGTASACNFETARVEVVFRKSLGPALGVFRRGDANADAKVDIADPIWIINELFREGPPTVCADAADANNDESLDIGDAQYLINYLFIAGPTPDGPFGECGTGEDDGETVDDALYCAEAQTSCNGG